MIFGYNTDVKAGDTVYHVQTEDRGDKNPVIDSVVYVKGRIIDRRRTPYLPHEQTPEQLQEIVKQQHRGLVEAIRGGSYRPPETAAPAPAAAPAEPAKKKTEPSGGSGPSGPVSVAAPAAVKGAAPNWSELLAAEAGESDPRTYSLELMNSSASEVEQQLVFVLKIRDIASGQPVPGGIVRALLRTEGGKEELQEVAASQEGIAEIRFPAPGEGKATVLFHAAGARPSGLLRFQLRRAN